MQNSKFFHPLLFVLLSLCAACSFAADPGAGRQKAAACTACHGVDGNSKNPAYPILAGQQADYLVAQLAAFQNGVRKNPMMQGIVKALNKQDMKDIAAFFSGVKPESAGGDVKLAGAGKSKFAMCSGCHGADAKGRATFPRLAGQHPAYIIKQLREFKAGVRKSGPMQAMTAGLSDQDMQAIAAYLATLD